MIGKLYSIDNKYVVQGEGETDWTIGMNNEILWLIVFFIDFGALLLIYKFLGKIGLFTWVAMATVIANIQVIKVIQLFGITAKTVSPLRMMAATTSMLFMVTEISCAYSKKNSATPVMLTARPMISLKRIFFLLISTSGTRISTGVRAIKVEAMPALA